MAADGPEDVGLWDSAPREAGLWDAVLGQPAATSVLQNALDRDEVAHAWLFAGPPGVGQREAAKALAADLNCDEAQTGRACGRCRTCTRIEAGSHAASRTFEPEGAFHVVDAVREEWIPTATRTLTEGQRQVLRIASADRMNEGAQNAFLKVLEEPPPSVVWVLEVEDEQSLLETVVSRCRRVDFVSWTPAALEAHAAREGVPEERRPALVRAAMGSPERLTDLARDDVAEARDRHVGVVARLAEEGPGIVVPLAKEITAWARECTKFRGAENERELERLEDAFGGEWPPGVRGRLKKRFERFEREERQRALTIFLDDLGSYLRDLTSVISGGDPADAVNADHAELLRYDAARVPLHVAIDGLEAVRDCGDALERNGQPELQLERLLLRLAVPIYLAETTRRGAVAGGTQRRR